MAVSLFPVRNKNWMDAQCGPSSSLACVIITHQRDFLFVCLFWLFPKIDRIFTSQKAGRVYKRFFFPKLLFLLFQNSGNLCAFWWNNKWSLFCPFFPQLTWIMSGSQPIGLPWNSEDCRRPFAVSINQCLKHVIVPMGLKKKKKWVQGYFHLERGQKALTSPAVT